MTLRRAKMTLEATFKSWARKVSDLWYKVLYRLHIVVLDNHYESYNIAAADTLDKIREKLLPIDPDGAFADMLKEIASKKIETENFKLSVIPLFERGIISREQSFYLFRGKRVKECSQSMYATFEDIRLNYAINGVYTNFNYLRQIGNSAHINNAYVDWHWYRYNKSLIEPVDNTYKTSIPMRSSDPPLSMPLTRDILPYKVIVMDVDFIAFSFSHTVRVGHSRYQFSSVNSLATTFRDMFTAVIDSADAKKMDEYEVYRNVVSLREM